MEPEYSYTWSRPEGTLAVCYSIEELEEVIKETGYIQPNLNKLRENLKAETESALEYTYGVVFKITKENLKTVAQ